MFGQISVLPKLLILCTLALSAILPILKYYNLNTSFYDLGVFDHNIFLYVTYGNWYWFVKSHFSPVLFVYSFIYEIIASPYVLLALQYSAVTFSAYLVYVISTKLFHNKMGLLFTVAYVVHPMYLYQIFWDFHTDHLFLPIFASIFYITECNHSFSLAKKNILLVILMILMVSLKENAILTAMFVGVYLLIKREYKLGLFTLLLSVIVFYCATWYIGYDTLKYSMRYIEYIQIGEQSLFPSFYHKWGKSYSELIQNILLHPMDLILHIVNDKTRLIFCIVLLCPFLITSILVPRFLIIAIPGLAMILLSTQYEKATIFHHYHASVFPVIFIASIFGFKKIQKNFAFFSKVYLVFLLVATCLYSYLYAPMPWGRFFYWNNINNYGYSKYMPTNRSQQIKSLLSEDKIVNAALRISFQNSIYSSYIGHRKHLDLFPKISSTTNLVIVDTKKIRNEAGLQKVTWLKSQWLTYKEYDGFFIFENPYQ